ncbi:MAG: hypothetical protein VKN83_08680 [Cyanobacteriota bacterium]|nr:hypothetical protein [Cyanobacteriota bacterium]
MTATPDSPKVFSNPNNPRTAGNPKRHGRSKTRQLLCPAHPEQRISGNGRKYFLHLLRPEELKLRGMSEKKAKLVIQAYPVLVLSNEWLEELFCPQCGTTRWCHVVRHDRVEHSVRWAPRDLWQQVAHVDPLVPNPSVSQFTRRAARRTDGRRLDGKRFYDP